MHQFASIVTVTLCSSRARSASAPSACAAPTEEFPAALAQSAAGVSRACTALAVLFSPPAPPTPSPGAPPTLGDCSLLCEGVEQSCVGLAAAFLQRPSPLGEPAGQCLEKGPPVTGVTLSI